MQNVIFDDKKWRLVPIEVVKEIGKLSTILSIEEYKERENYCVDEEDMANTFMDAYDMFINKTRAYLALQGGSNEDTR